jgi:hypothetical protein
MHFLDPKALAGLHVIGSRDVKLGIVEGVYADIRSGLFGTELTRWPSSRPDREHAGAAPPP